MMNILRKGSRGNDVKMLQTALNLITDGIFGDLTEEAVKDFQRVNGLQVDGIVGSDTWEKLLTQENDAKIKKSVRNIKEIIIHCSDTPEGKDFTVSDIRSWHLARNFSDIGYHYVIYRDGSIHEGRNVNISGAHCTNHNSISIGICYIGGRAAVGTTPKDTRTEAQKKSLVDLLNKLRKIYPNATIHGHKEFAAKACPSFDAKREYANI
jgi:N-acetylmuramoyl-L-alanine amidase